MEQAKLSKNYRHFEIIIASFYISLSILFSWIHLEFISDIQKTRDLVQIPYTNWAAFKDFYVAIILNFLLFLGGIFLILNRAIGWVLSLAVSFHIIVYGIKLSFILNRLEIEYYKYIIGGIIFLLILWFSITLILKPFRVKYDVDLQKWGYIIIIDLYLLIDHLLI